MGIMGSIMALEDRINKLPRSKQDFARSLCSQFRQKRRLSQLQQLHVDKLIEEANNPPPPPPPPERIELGNFTPLMELFARAKANKIAVPRIKTFTENGRAMELAAANPGGKNPGCIYVTLEGDYYGKVNPSGEIELRRGTVVCEEVHARAKYIGENPTEAGRVHGHKYDDCMFCGRGLKTTDSVYFGYGPICADKWGLEWGTARERKVEDRIERNEQAANTAFADAIKQVQFKF